MKAFYKRFDFLLNWLLVGTILFTPLSFVVLSYLARQYTGIENLSSTNIVGVFGSVITILSLISFLFAVIYFITGIVFLVIGARKKKKNDFSLGKEMLLKGFVRGIIAFFNFFIVSLVLSFFGLSAGNLTISAVSDQNNPTSGFPIQDLQIIKWQDQKGNSDYCDIVIRNNNSMLTATNINILAGQNDNINASGRSHIPPGKTLAIAVDAYGPPHDPCSGVSIYDAGIVKQKN